MSAGATCARGENRVALLGGQVERPCAGQTPRIGCVHCGPAPAVGAGARRVAHVSGIGDRDAPPRLSRYSGARLSSRMNPRSAAIAARTSASRSPATLRDVARLPRACRGPASPERCCASRARTRQSARRRRVDRERSHVERDVVVSRSPRSRAGDRVRDRRPASTSVGLRPATRRARSGARVGPPRLAAAPRRSSPTRVPRARAIERVGAVRHRRTGRSRRARARSAATVGPAGVDQETASRNGIERVDHRPARSSPTMSSNTSSLKSTPSTRRGREHLGGVFTDRADPAGRRRAGSAARVRGPKAGFVQCRIS